MAENIILSVLKIVGAFVILLNINGWLALAAFAVLPVMFVFAFALNKRMRRAFQQNRIKIAEINEQIEDNLSGIRVVKSFANEAIENEKFRHGNDGFLAAKKNSYHYMGSFQAGVGVFTTLIQVNVILAGGFSLQREWSRSMIWLRFCCILGYLLIQSGHWWTLPSSFRMAIRDLKGFRKL